MIDRRDFVKAASSAITLSPLFLNANIFGKMNNIGIQLFSLPKLLSEDFAAGIAMLAKMGYTQLELFGPYTFSDTKAKESWKHVGSMLGFSGSGTFGHSTKDLIYELKGAGMSVPSCHTDLDTLMDHMGQLAEFANEVGAGYVILPAIPDEKRQSLDDYRRICDDFNAIGENARKEGVRFAYHNHGYGLSAWDGRTPLDLIFENTDPELVFFEMDIFWTVAGGLDPVALLEKYKGRYDLLHIKDMKPKTRFKGDGNDVSQWMELFPLITNAGEGELEVAKIIDTAVETGVTYYFVEQDLSPDPETALAKSANYLMGLK